MKPVFIPCILHGSHGQAPLWLPGEMKVIAQPPPALGYNGTPSLRGIARDGFGIFSQGVPNVRPLPLRRFGAFSHVHAPIGRDLTYYSLDHEGVTHTGRQDYRRHRFETDCGLAIKVSDEKRVQTPITCLSCRQELEEWVLLTTLGEAPEVVRVKRRVERPTAHAHLLGEVDYGRKTVRHPVEEPVLEDQVLHSRDRKVDRFRSARGA